MQQIRYLSNLPPNHNWSIVLFELQWENQLNKTYTSACSQLNTYFTFCKVDLLLLSSCRPWRRTILVAKVPRYYFFSLEDCREKLFNLIIQVTKLETTCTFLSHSEFINNVMLIYVYNKKYALRVNCMNSISLIDFKSDFFACQDEIIYQELDPKYVRYIHNFMKC